MYVFMCIYKYRKIYNNIFAHLKNIKILFFSFSLDDNAPKIKLQSERLYGVATVSRIDQIIGLFCKIFFLSYGSFAKETYNFIDPTNRSRPIAAWLPGLYEHIYVDVYLHMLKYIN